MVPGSQHSNVDEENSHWSFAQVFGSRFPPHPSPKLSCGNFSFYCTSEKKPQKNKPKPKSRQHIAMRTLRHPAKQSVCSQTLMVPQPVPVFKNSGNSTWFWNHHRRTNHLPFWRMGHLRHILEKPAGYFSPWVRGQPSKWRTRSTIQQQRCESLRNLVSLKTAGGVRQNMERVSYLCRWNSLKLNRESTK